MEYGELWYRRSIPYYRWKKFKKFIQEKRILKPTLDITYEQFLITIGNLSLKKIEADRIFSEAELVHHLLLNWGENLKPEGSNFKNVANVIRKDIQLMEKIKTLHDKLNEKDEEEKNQVEQEIQIIRALGTGKYQMLMYEIEGPATERENILYLYDDEKAFENMLKVERERTLHDNLAYDIKEKLLRIDKKIGDVNSFTFPEIVNNEDIIPKLGTTLPLKADNVIHVSNFYHQQIEIILEILNRREFVVVTGEPGVGKSTLLFLVWKELKQRNMTSRWLSGKSQPCNNVLFYDDLNHYIDIYYRGNIEDFCEIFDQLSGGVIFTCRSQEYFELIDKTPIIKKKFTEIVVAQTSTSDMKEILSKYATFNNIEVKDDAIDSIIKKSDGIPLYPITLIDYALDERIKGIDLDYVKNVPPSFSEFIQDIVYYNFKYKTYFVILELLAKKWNRSYSGLYGIPIEYLNDLQPYIAHMLNESELNLPPFTKKFRYLLRYEYFKGEPQTIRFPHKFWADTISEMSHTIDFDYALFHYFKVHVMNKEAPPNLSIKRNKPLYNELNELFIELGNMCIPIRKCEIETYTKTKEKIERMRKLNNACLEKYIYLFMYGIDDTGRSVSILPSHNFNEEIIKKCSNNNSIITAFNQAAEISWFISRTMTDLLMKCPEQEGIAIHPLSLWCWFKTTQLLSKNEEVIRRNVMAGCPLINKEELIKSELMRCKLVLYLNRSPDYQSVVRNVMDTSEGSTYVTDWLNNILEMSSNELISFPNDASWHFIKGITLFYLDKKSEAKSEIENAIKLNIDISYFECIGQFLLETGEKERGSFYIDMYRSNYCKRFQPWEDTRNSRLFT